jgi:hypothetical protein
MLPAGMLPASMAMYLPGCGLDLATSMPQQAALQQLHLQQQLQAAAQAAQAGLDSAFIAGMERQDQRSLVRIALLLHWLLASQGPQHVQVLSPLP